jgi:hypothetical protein
MAGLLKRRTSGEERLDAASMERVIEALESEKPITKTAACAMLNIAYNTSRLDKLITTYKEKKELDSQRRKAKRGKPVTMDEIGYMVSEYLEGATIDSISKGIYRGADFVKRVLEENHVTLRKAPHSYFKPELIPDGAVRDRFAIGEKVYSVRYDSLAIIKAESIHKDGMVYRVWLDSENTQEFAYQPAWELASLQHLRDKGIAI